MGGLAGTVGEAAAIADPLPIPMLGMQMLTSLHSSATQHCQIQPSWCCVDAAFKASITLPSDYT